MAPFDYLGKQGKRWEGFDCTSVLDAQVLPFLTGHPWDEFALAYVQSLRPSFVRVIRFNGDETTDGMLWRVTVYLAEGDQIIDRIEQEVEVGLPFGVAHGHDLWVKSRARNIRV